MSISSVSEKQVYMLVEDGSGKHIKKMDLKDVPLFERFKNVFGCGAMNLGNIVDYCLQKANQERGSIQCDFGSFQSNNFEFSEFIRVMRKNPKMQKSSEQTRKKVYAKLADYNNAKLNFLRKNLVDHLRCEAGNPGNVEHIRARLKKAASVLSKPNLYLESVKGELMITHESVDKNTNIRQEFLLKLVDSVLGVDHEYRFQMATILISMNSLSKRALETFVDFLIQDQQINLVAARRGKIHRFKPHDYNSLKKANIPRFEDLPPELQKKSTEFLAEMGKLTSAHYEAMARSVPLTEEELKKLSKKLS